MRKAKTVQKVPFLAPDVETKVIPAPTDGWDQISPLAEMDPKRAPILTNWVPRPGYVEVREGSYPYSPTSTSPVETLMIYRPPTGQTMFAAAGSKIYDASNPGSAVAVNSGLSSARWQYVGNFTPSGAATVLQCVNGVDPLQQWAGDGNTMGIANLSNASPIEVTSANPTSLATGDQVAIAGVLGAIPVTGASNTNPIQITVADPTTLVNGALVTIFGVGGNTAANVTNHPITVIDSTHFTLNGIAGNGNYTSGGTLVGNSNANGTFTVTVIDNLHYTLNGTTGNGAYASGSGTAEGSFWSEPVITGLNAGDTTASFINIFAQKQRLWYIKKNSTLVYFMPTQAVQGPVAGFQDFGSLFGRGGYLIAMADWTIDGGNGPQDYVAFLSSQGQIALYSGTDPTNSNAWSLVGVFSIGRPIGYRCVCQLGSDVGIITLQGVLPISQVLPFDPSADRSVAITARIQNAMAQAAQSYNGNFGWQLIAFPGQQFLVLNIPTEENTSQIQYIMNTLTGAWAQFTGWNANCFEIFNDDLYFGDNLGNVVLAYTGLTDSGAAIELDMQCAFNWFDEPGKEKRMTMIQPLLSAQGAVSPTLSVDTDFATSNVVNPITISPQGSLWDQAIWDTALWNSGTINFTSWLSVEAIGHAFAARMHFILPSNLGVGGFDIAKFDSGVFDGTPNGSSITLQVNAFNAILETGGPI